MYGNKLKNLKKKLQSMNTYMEANENSTTSYLAKTKKLVEKKTGKRNFN